MQQDLTSAGDGLPVHSPAQSLAAGAIAAKAPNAASAAFVGPGGSPCAASCVDASGEEPGAGEAAPSVEAQRFERSGRRAGAADAAPISLILVDKSCTEKSEGEKGPENGPGKGREYEVVPLEGITKRLKRLTRAKKLGEDIAAWGVQQGGEVCNRALKQMECSTYLHFRQYFDNATGEDLGETRLVRANFCCQPYSCPGCGIARGAKCVRVYGPRLEHLRFTEPDTKLLFVTLTVRDGEDLGERFAALMGGRRRLLQRRKDAGRAGRRKASVMGQVLAGAGNVELKRGTGSGLWHPHYHGVWLVRGRISFADLQGEWEEVLQGAGMFANFQHLYAEKMLAPGAEWSEEFSQRLAKDLCEVFKYSVKFTDLESRAMSPADVWHAWSVLRGRQLLGAFGLMRGLKVDDDYAEPDDGLRSFRDRVFHYDKMLRAYAEDPLTEPLRLEAEF